MSILTSLQNFLVYLRLHKWRSRKTQEQYAFHIWRFICWMVPVIAKHEAIQASEKQSMDHFPSTSSGRTQPRDDETKNESRKTNHEKLSPTLFLPPLDREAVKNWKSPLIDLAKVYPEPTIEDIKKEDFDAWRLSLADSWLSVKTVNAHIITIRSWLKYLKKEEVNCLDPTVLDLMRVQDREVTFLTNEEIERFFSAIPRETIQWKRDYAICECIYSTGLRISELTALDRADVNFETLEFAVRGKWGKLRVVYLTETARDAIASYLDARDDDFGALFIRHNYNKDDIKSFITRSPSLSGEGAGGWGGDLRLTRFFITGMVKEYGIRAWILKNLHAHTLRHSFATTLLTNGADIRIIQELLGHASITTTQVYTHVTNPKLKEAHKKFHK